MASCLTWKDIYWKQDLHDIEGVWDLGGSDRDNWCRLAQICGKHHQKSQGLRQKSSTNARTYRRRHHKTYRIRIKRISGYNSFKADEYIQGLEEELKQVAFDLENLNDFAIAYFERLLEKYGKEKKRKTEITSIEQIQVRQVVANNAKLCQLQRRLCGHGHEEGRLCMWFSDIDDVIAFTRGSSLR